LQAIQHTDTPFASLPLTATSIIRRQEKYTSGETWL
jgi:hypothetical protein